MFNIYITESINKQVKEAFESNRLIYQIWIYTKRIEKENQIELKINAFRNLFIIMEKI